MKVSGFSEYALYFLLSFKKAASQPTVLRQHLCMNVSFSLSGIANHQCATAMLTDAKGQETVPVLNTHF